MLILHATAEAGKVRLTAETKRALLPMCDLSVEAAQSAASNLEAAARTATLQRDRLQTDRIRQLEREIAAREDELAELQRARDAASLVAGA